MKFFNVLIVVMFSVLVSSKPASAHYNLDLSWILNNDGVSALGSKYKQMVHDFIPACDTSEGTNNELATACAIAKLNMATAIEAQTWDKNWTVTYQEQSPALRFYHLSKSLPLYNTPTFSYACFVNYTVSARKVSKELVVADISVACY